MGFVFGGMKIMYIVIKHGWADGKKKKKKMGEIKKSPPPPPPLTKSGSEYNIM